MKHVDYDGDDIDGVSIICNLIGHLVSQICRDISEWENWGKFFVSEIFLIQFGQESVSEINCNRILLYYEL